MNEKSTTTDQLSSSEAPKRVITIISTRGEKKKIEFDGTEWGELRPLVKKAGYDIDNMTAVEGTQNHTLDHDKAIVPDGDFKLFLMPYESKSGASNRTELYGQIKQFKADNPDAANSHFGNHTNKSTSELADLVESYAPGTKKAVKTEKAKAISDVVALASVNATNREEKLSVLGDLTKMSIEEKMDFLICLGLAIKEELTTMGKGGKVAEFAADLTAAAISTEISETEEERVTREAGELKAQEEAEAEAERLRKQKEDEDETAELLADMERLGKTSGKGLRGVNKSIRR